MCLHQPNPASSDFLAGLLAKLDPDARLVDFALADRNYYTLRIDLPGDGGKSFTVPCRIVEKAATGDPRWDVVLRNVLWSALLTIRAQRTIQRSRGAVSGTSAEPICPACSQRIPLGEGVAVERGGTFHVRCRR
jgi:hypothetical protein